MKLPKHVQFILTHNGHNASYETVKEYLEHIDIDHPNYVEDYWVSLEQALKSLRTNELWEAQWYPDTPIGFYKKYSCDLEPLLEALATYE